MNMERCDCKQLLQHDPFMDGYDMRYEYELKLDVQHV